MSIFRKLTLLTLLLLLAAFVMNTTAHAEANPPTANLQDGSLVTVSGAQVQLYSLKNVVLGAPVPLDTTQKFTQAAISGETVAALTATGELVLYRYPDGAKAATLITRFSDESKKGVYGGLALNKDTVAVLTQGNDPADKSGAVDIYARKADKWERQTTLSLVKYPDLTGASLALYGDYLMIAVPGQGVVVYLRNAEAWDEQTVIKPESGEVPKRFGASIAMSERTAAIGSPDTNSVYLFTRGDTAWAQRAIFTSADTTDLGLAVAVSDLDVLAVGSKGAVVYGRVNSPDWKPIATLKADAPVTAYLGVAALSKTHIVIGTVDSLLVYTRSKDNLMIMQTIKAAKPSP